MSTKAWTADCQGEWVVPAPDPEHPHKKKAHFIPYVMSRREVGELLGSSYVTPLEGLVVRLLYAGGLRATELTALGREDLNAEMGALKVGERLVMLDRETVRQLEKLEWKKNWQWDLVAVKEIVRRAARGCAAGKRYEAMGRKILPNALRVAFAVHWLEGGGGLFGLHQMLGYRWLADTENVIELSVGLWRGVYDRAHPLALGALRGGQTQSDLPLSEVKMMLDAVGAAEKDGPLNGLALRTIYAAGLRISELADLLVADVDLVERRLFLRDCKEDKDRFTLIDEETAQLLAPLVDGRGLAESVFGMTDDHIQYLVKKAGEDTGLLKKYNALKQTLSPHTFRRAFATGLYQGGVEPGTIKRLMGHQSVEQTMDYVDCHPQRLREAFDRCSPVNGFV